MPQKIRLGFVGGGYMGQVAHIRNFARLSGECELVALAELRPKLAQTVADRYGIAELYPDHRTLLAKADVDAVVAIMNYGLHHAVVPDILNAGKHLLTEKPMGCRASAAREWKKLADEKKLVYLVGYMKRWDLGARYARDLIAGWKQSGEYGKLTYLRCNMTGMDWTWSHAGPFGTGEKPSDFSSALAGEPFPEQFTDAEARFYNMNINFFVHQVNLIRFLIGEDYRLTHAHPNGKVLLATADSGIGITLEMQLSSIPQTWDEVYHICFERADIELRVPAPLREQHNAEVVIRRATGNSHETIRANIAPPSWSFFEQAKGFLQAVRERKLPHDSTGDAIRDLETFEEQVTLMKAAGGKM
jgi:predicted dehydrogenase